MLYRYPKSKKCPYEIPTKPRLSGFSYTQKKLNSIFCERRTSFEHANHRQPERRRWQDHGLREPGDWAGADRKKKVLLIDGDPQGSLTISLGHPQPDKLPFTLSDAMSRILMDEPLKPSEGILHHPEGVDLMPADIQLSGMEVSLVNAMSRETILQQTASC